MLSSASLTFCKDCWTAGLPPVSFSSSLHSLLGGLSSYHLDVQDYAKDKEGWHQGVMPPFLVFGITLDMRVCKTGGLDVQDNAKDKEGWRRIDAILSLLWHSLGHAGLQDGGLLVGWLL